MALVRVEPTNVDVAIADAISGHTRPGLERAAKALTWGADEHILCALAAGWWLCCRGKDSDYRRASDHVLLTTLVSSALPHLLKVVFDQERPDRRTIRGHLRGIPFSGKRLDAFPSGHAMHVGALASVASRLPAKQRNVIWSLGAGLVLTRIVLLAHWASDVAVGLAVGVLTERLLRKLTGYGRERDRAHVIPQVLPRRERRIYDRSIAARVKRGVILLLALIGVSIACRTSRIEAAALKENIARYAQEAVQHEFS